MVLRERSLGMIEMLSWSCDSVPSAITKHPYSAAAHSLRLGDAAVPEASCSCGTDSMDDLRWLRSTPRQLLERGWRSRPLRNRADKGFRLSSREHRRGAAV